MRRTLEPGPNFHETQSQFCHGAAQGVSMHPQLLGGLTLVSPVRNEHFPHKCPLELTNRIFIADSGGMHLRHKAVQFPSHVHLCPFF
jgi:hypothetical protein